MLNQVLFKNQNSKQLLIAVIGSFLGITFLVTSIHYLIKVNDFGKGAEILGPNTIIVQKKVNTGAVLGLAKTDFSELELEQIKAKPFIEDAKPVVSNNFKVYFETNDPHVPSFSSVVFIQSVDKSFIGATLDNWSWNEKDSIVPMIMPRDFLVMLNTFMSASGIPQVSEELAKDIRFKFTISNKNKRESFDVQIVGFTNSVASILVPQSFMDYGNDNFGADEPQKITQIMLSGKESEFGLVEELLKKRGLESKNSQMVVGRLKSMVGTLILVILGVSIIAVFVSCLVLIQYMQLLMTKNEYEVRTLLRLGYNPRQIVRNFFIYFLKIFGIVAVLGLLVFFLFKYFLDKMFETGGLYIDTNLSLIALAALLFSYLLFAFASYRTAKNGIFNAYDS